MPFSYENRNDLVKEAKRILANLYGLTQRMNRLSQEQSTTRGRKPLFDVLWGLC